MAHLKITDARPSTIASKYDLPPPVTTYASALRNTALFSQNQIQHSTNVQGSMVVNRRPRRNGLRYFYSHGGVVQPAPQVPTPGAGGVRNSLYQTILVQLHDWSTNLAIFAAGYPRNLGYTTRVSQLQTKVSGGPTNATMDTKPIFPAVQRVRRYTVQPRTYQTRSTNG